MKYPFAVISDTHYHNWTTFSHTNEDGVNSRLQIQLDATKECVETLVELGGDTVFHCGDVFHTRGRIIPSAFNPVLDTYKELANKVQFFVISGNHDLESRDSDRLSSAATGLSGHDNITTISEPTVFSMIDTKVIMVPWFERTSEMMESLKSLRDSVEDPTICEVFIHAPLNDVIKGIPDHGINPEDLAELGFKHVFCGHYHNHKRFEKDTVISVGSLTDQTFSDINAKSGYLIVHEDGRVDHYETSAPQFVDLTEVTDQDEFEKLAQSNYVRLRLQDLTDKEADEIKMQLKLLGAQGVNMNVVKSKPVIESRKSVKTETIEGAIECFIKEAGYENPKQLLDEALSILNQSEESL